MPVIKHPIRHRIYWSRRRWLASIGRLFFGAWLWPTHSLKAQPQLGSSHEKTLRLFVDALLPADEFTPAASALNVHLQIMKDAKQDPSLGLLIADGCIWLTNTVGSLEALTPEQLEQLLQAMSESGWETGPRNFFHIIRDHAVMYYYANPRAWAGSPINHPPQPIGYPELIIN